LQPVEIEQLRREYQIDTRQRKCRPPSTVALDDVSFSIEEGEILGLLDPKRGWSYSLGLGWLILALASFRWLAEGGRKDGSIEFGS
jgi:hypothetical protein